MAPARSPKRRFKLVLHGTKSKKTYLIDTIVQDFQSSNIKRIQISSET
jgi:hypothetical protein